MNRRRYRVGGIVVALAVTLLPAALPTPSYAQTSDDQREVVQQLTDKIEALEQQSDILAEDYVTAVDEKNQLDAQVAAAEQRVAEKQAAVDALRDQLAQVAVQAYMGAGTNGFGPMFSSSTEVTDGLARDQLARVAVSAGTATTDEFDQAVKDLEEEEQALADARSAAEQKAAQIADAKEAADEQKAEAIEARTSATEELQRLVREEEERRARESYERQKAAEAAAAAQRAQEQANAAAAQRAAAASTSNGGGGGSGESSGGSAQALAAPAASRQPVPQASSRAGTAVAAALSQQGVAYRFAASQPGVAFDCSGLTAWAWAQAGVSLPHQSRAQQGSVQNIPVSEAQPGDLLFFYSPISHVSIYLGGGQHVHAPNSGSVVNVASVNWNNVVAVGRPG
ncbi:MAG TPA: NlpC/P60 family protein [Ilumatobacteraceae bacterium]|nr:NlpC/P60 family protein [Ilumatobacteraceae bacterium]